MFNIFVVVIYVNEKQFQCIIKAFPLNLHNDDESHIFIWSIHNTSSRLSPFISIMRQIQFNSIPICLLFLCAHLRKTKCLASLFHRNHEQVNRVNRSILRRYWKDSSLSVHSYRVLRLPTFWLPEIYKKRFIFSPNIQLYTYFSLNTAHNEYQENKDQKY